MQVEAVARITNDKSEIQRFIDKYKVKFPQYYKLYSGTPDEATVICVPIRFALYKYIDGKPCTDVLDVYNNRAYCEELE